MANVLDGSWLEDVLNGDRMGTFNGCAEAVRFAALNDAGNVECSQLSGRWGFHVNVTSNKTMGESILPGLENTPAESSSTAVVEPRCTFEPDPDADGESPSPLPQNNGGTSGDDKDEKPPSPGKITCDDGEWQIDPDHLDLLPDMADLFTVRLAED